MRAKRVPGCPPRPPNPALPFGSSLWLTHTRSAGFQAVWRVTDTPLTKSPVKYLILNGIWTQFFFKKGTGLSGAVGGFRKKRKGRSHQRTPGNLDNSAARGEVCPTRGEIVKGSLYLHDTVTPRVYWSATSALAPHLPSPHPPPSLPAGASGHTRRSAANQPCPL